MRSHLFPVFLAILCTLTSGLLAPPARAAIDNYSTGPGQGPGDGMCDVWQALYNAWGLTPSADDDGDKCDNLIESIAGTDPFDSKDCYKVGNTTLTATDVIFTIPVEAGKKYRVVSDTTLGPAATFATVETHVLPVPGATELNPMADNPAQVLSVTRSGAMRFYKIEVSDNDGDSDGVSTWAELKTGFDPVLPDTDDDGEDDLVEMNAELAAPDLVSITATEPFASEDGPLSGCVTVSRTRSLTTATIFYSLTGTATDPADYSPSPAGVSIVLAPGQKTADIFVNPAPDAELEGSESVTTTLTNATAGEFAPPTISTPDNATVIIGNSLVPSGTGLLGQYYDTASSNYANAANFNPAQLKLTRVDPTVDFNWLYGTPNGNTKPAAGPGENYSVRWTGYLEPNAAGNHTFRLLTEGDDQARVLFDADGSGPGGLVQILENGWDTPATGAYKNSASYTLAIPPGPADRYQIRLEFIETTGDATCRFQWDPPNAGFQNIPSARVYRNNTGTGTANQRYEAIYYNGTNQDFSLNTQAGTTQYDTATTNGNNGIWGVGSPDPSMDRNTFSIRWTGQIQPQFTEEYTLSVIADNGCRMWINDEEVDFRVATNSNIGGARYDYVSATGVTTINYTNSWLVADQFAVGDIIRLDPTSGTLASFASLDYTVQAATPTSVTVTFPTGFGDDTNRNMNIGGINRQLKPWASTGAERFTRIPLIGGVRYNIKLDYYETTSLARCRLFWHSPSQPEQIIPTERLYPSDLPALAPTAHITPTDATAIVGGAFSLPIAGSNGASVVLSGNPAWLTYAGGVLSGTPPPGSGGVYQVIVTITNADGTSTSVVNLIVAETDGQVEREYWNGVSGTDVADIPTGAAPSGTNTLSTLEAATDFGDNYGARVRGYITAPETGNYYFWIAASNAAELWISNDDETVNSFKRAEVVTGSTTPQTWNAEPSQRSPWLALEQGQRYYFEILHKAGVGVGDNLAVGWALPGESDAAPSEVVPGYVLDTYTPPAPGSTPGTLYVATMLAQGSAVSNGVGVATLRLSEDENVAWVNLDEAAYLTPPYGGMTGIMTDWHVHNDPFQGNGSSIMYDPTAPPADSGLQANGLHKWTIPAISGTLTKADVVELIKQGKAYINLHTAAYPAGEIRGNFTLADGSRTFTPPPPPPAWADDSDTNVGAARFLTQASYGPNIADITALKGLAATSTSGRPPTRYETWIDDQFTKPAGLHLPEVLLTEDANAQGGAFTENLTFNAWWWRSVAGDDQLRQRIAFALSEIHVVSAQGPLDNRAQALSYFYDKLVTNAFGNFRDILQDTTLTWPMGRYLDMWRNDKPDPSLGRIPNENFAREIKQLFSIGLFRMWPDGTLILDSSDSPIDTYSQREIIGFSHVFTGWDYYYTGPYRTALNAPANFTAQMREVPARHYTGEKRLLNNEVLPGLKTVGSQPLDPIALHTTLHYNDAAYQALPMQELEASHDQLFNQPNVGPFICRQLIQRLVTSDPSRDYLYRVVSAFNDNGSGVRGDMQAVIKAILLDYEARSPAAAISPAFGKQREPVMRVAAAARAFRTETFTGTYTQANTSQTTNHQIFITTPTPHGLSSGNVHLTFEDTTGDPNQPAPFSGIYGISSVGPTTFRVTDKAWLFSTGSGYTIPANSTTCTAVRTSHWLQPGHQVYIDFRTGALAGDPVLDESVYTVTATSGETGTNATFQFEIPPAEVSTSTRSGAFRIQRFSPGSSTARASGLPYPNDRRVTMDTDFDHHLKVGDTVQLNYFNGNPLPLDAVVTVDTVEDFNTWTYLTNSDVATGFATNENNNSVYQFPLVRQPTMRAGTVGSRPSTFRMNNTDADLDQAPLNAPTVFNFFLPDYKYPGSLASQGITTPEFQTTAETTVVRQANYLYEGLFFPTGNTTGLSSFDRGSNALVMDFSPWMPVDATDLGLGAPTNANLPWTHNQNLDELIDQLSILLTSDQLSTAAKDIIRNFVSRKISSITAGSPCFVNTTGDHGFITGDQVVISGVTGGTFSPANALTNTTTLRTITVIDSDTFRVTGVNLLSGNPNENNAHVSPVVYNQGTTNPSATNKRDRLRAIIHLILTSPDFTIQR